MHKMVRRDPYVSAIQSLSAVHVELGRDGQSGEVCAAPFVFGIPA